MKHGRHVKIFILPWGQGLKFPLVCTQSHLVLIPLGLSSITQQFSLSDKMLLLSSDRELTYPLDYVVFCAVFLGGYLHVEFIPACL